MESKIQAIMWKSMKIWIRNLRPKWPFCILFEAIYRENKQWASICFEMPKNRRKNNTGYEILCPENSVKGCAQFVTSPLSLERMVWSHDHLAAAEINITHWAFLFSKVAWKDVESFKSGIRMSEIILIKINPTHSCFSIQSARPYESTVLLTEKRWTTKNIHFSFSRLHEKQKNLKNLW